MESYVSPPPTITQDYDEILEDDDETTQTSRAKRLIKLLERLLRRIISMIRNN